MGHYPVANLDAEGRLVRLHCGTPGERCNLDEAEDKETVTWFIALELYWREMMRLRQGMDSFEELPIPLCQFCFGGEGE